MSKSIPELGGVKMFKEDKGVPWIVFGFCLIAMFAVGWLIGVNNEPIGQEVTQEIVLSDLETELGSLKTGQLAIAQNQNILFQGQVAIVSNIVNSNLCGNNLFVPDSNRLVDSPRGVVYSCFAGLEGDLN